MDFLRALGFLTILPCTPVEKIEDGFLRTVGWFPFVGAFLGAGLGFFHYGASMIFPPLPAASLGVVLWAFLTRGFHLDGLADTFDGIGGGFDKAGRLAVMKDSRLGTFGGLALISALLLKVSLIHGLTGATGIKALFLAPVMGRWAMVIAMKFFPSARPGGMGDLFRKGATKGRLALASITAVFFAAAVGGLPEVLLLFLIPLFTWGASRWLTALLGGLTGDSYGALCEGAEILSLALLTLS